MEFLSPEWVESLDRAARGVGPEVLGDLDLVIDHEVPGVRRWRHVFADGRAAVVDISGHSDLDPADVRFTSSPDTAADIAAGRRSASEAFMAGDLRLGGDQRRLVDALRALVAIGDAVARSPRA